MTDLAALFPEGDFRFHLGLRRGEPAEFFRSHDTTGAVLAERRRWLRDEPARYAALLPEGRPLQDEFAGMVADWGASETRAADDSALAKLAALGGALEPDFLLLALDGAGQPRLLGGALCFPTGWALAEKLGHPLDFIHGVVPGLNPAIGASIQQFLARLKPGVAFLRDNWGLAATPELNMHPARVLPPPQPPVSLDRLWLRVEHQALVALPRSGGFVFGIRIALHRLDGVARGAGAKALAQALRTMPAEVAAYKRLDTVRDEVAAQLSKER